MKNRIRSIVSFLVFLLGTGGLIFLYKYGPQLESRKVIVAAVTIGENQIIEAHHIHFESKPISAVPKNAILVPDQVIGKVAKGVIPSGAYFYPEWLEDDGFYPKEGEIILPVNSQSIFAVNLSLRSRDIVHIAFFKRSQATQNEPIDLDQTFVPIEKSDDSIYLKNVRVAAVRSSSGNIVFDLEGGGYNGRMTSTGTIGSIELIVTEDDAALIKNKLEKDFLLWISRMK